MFFISALICAICSSVSVMPLSFAASVTASFILSASVRSFSMTSFFTSFISFSASSLPIASASAPVVTSSSVAADFCSSLKVSPLAFSYAIMIPVSAPVPDTSNGAAATTLQFSTPEVSRVDAIMELVTKVRFPTLTWIPPLVVGST